METKVRQALMTPCGRCGNAMRLEPGTHDARCWICGYRVSSAVHIRYLQSTLATAREPKTKRARHDDYVRIKDRDLTPRDSIDLIWMVHGRDPLPELCLMPDCFSPSTRRAKSGYCVRCADQHKRQNGRFPVLWANVAAQWIAPVLIVSQLRKQSVAGVYYSVRECLWPEEFPLNRPRYREVRAQFRRRRGAREKGLVPQMTLKPADEIIPIYQYYLQEFGQ